VAAPVVPPDRPVERPVPWAAPVRTQAAWRVAAPVVQAEVLAVACKEAALLARPVPLAAALPARRAVVPRAVPEDSPLPGVMSPVAARKAEVACPVGA
jgi:hypothetical protein